MTDDALRGGQKVSDKLREVPSNEQLKKWRQLAENTFMVSALGEYTPVEFIVLLEEVERLRAALALAGAWEVERALEVAKARLNEATNWHQYGTQHDEDGWCCKRENELRDEVMVLEAGGALGATSKPVEGRGE